MSAANFEISKTVGDLRDHLARHDKPAAFLFGAGTSCAIDKVGVLGTPVVPAVAGLTKICRADVEALGDKFKEGWKHLEENCDQSGLPKNIENLLSRLRLIVAALGKNDVMLGLTKIELSKFEETIRKSIARTVNVDLALVPDETPHRQFARWILRASRKMPIEIFTVNYDMLIEAALERERVPYFDGFVGGYQPFFHVETLRRIELAPAAGWVRLWKIHGSVNWKKLVIDGTTRITRGAPSDSGEMILPSFEKYDESRQQPYLAFIDRLQRFLEQEDALLVTQGFSFGDDHINSVIFEALSHRPRSHLFAIQHSDMDVGHVLWRRALLQKNIEILTPSKGVLGGLVGGWQLSADLPHRDTIFEKDKANPGEPDLISGKSKLGDFKAFCAFLSTF